MKTDNECLFLVSSALQEVARAVYSGASSFEGDKDMMDKEFVEFQGALTEILENHESSDDLALVQSRLINRISNLKLRASNSSEQKSSNDSSSMSNSSSALNNSKSMPLKELLARELGISQVDISGMNHMNLPLNTWAEQEESAMFYASGDSIKLSSQEMKSPLMARLLLEWSSDVNKQLYVLNWADCLNKSLPDAFPQGLQIVGLSPLLKEGFLMLLIPVVRRSSSYPLRVYLRRRLRDEVSTGLLAGPQGFDFLYDLRIRVITPQSSLVQPKQIHSTPSSQSQSQSSSKVINSTAESRSSSQDMAVAGGSSGWFSSLLPQTGPLADLLDWVNRPAADNSYLEAMEVQEGRGNRSRSGSRGSESGAVPYKTAEEHATDRAWSLANGSRDRVNSTESSNSSHSSGYTRGVDADLERYGFDSSLPTADTPYSTPPVLSRNSSILAGNDDSYVTSSLLVASGVEGTYMAPVDIQSNIPSLNKIAPSGKLSLVEAKLKAMREAKK